MNSYQLRISIIPVLLLSTATGMIVWQARSGLVRRRNAHVAGLVYAYQQGYYSDAEARERLGKLCKQQDLRDWMEYPTPKGRRAAVQALQLVGTQQSVPVLARLLLHERDAALNEATEAAIRTVRRRTGRPKVDEALHQALNRVAEGRIEAALESLDRCSRLMPEFAEPHYVYGTILLGREDLEGAVEAFSNAVELDSSHFDARLGRAISNMRIAREGDLSSLEVARKIAEARDDCLQILRKINPHMQEARLLLDGM